MKTVYLAGPITGLDFESANKWREEFSKSTDKIEFLNPLRGKDYLRKEKDLKDNYSEFVMSTIKGITSRDRWDATRCDLLVVNLLGAMKVSIGSVLEIAWADSKRIPIITIMEDFGNIHDHGMINEICGFRVKTVEEAVKITKHILNIEEKEENIFNIIVNGIDIVHKSKFITYLDIIKYSGYGHKLSLEGYNFSVTAKYKGEKKGCIIAYGIPYDVEEGMIINAAQTNNS